MSLNISFSKDKFGTFKHILPVHTLEGGVAKGHVHFIIIKAKEVSETAVLACLFSSRNFCRPYPRFHFIYFDVCSIGNG